MRILTEYSLWFIPLCLIAGVFVAYLLYRNDSQLRDIPAKIKILLFSLRTAIVSLVLFLLLGPFVETKKKDIKKPVIVVLQDNSASILLHKDSLFFKQQYVNDLQKFTENLQNEFDVDVYEIGNGFYKDSLISFTDKQTNISSAFQEISSRYYNRNLGAIVLASDGIYNAGENPLYAVQNMSVSAPVYSMALGDTIQLRDNVIADVLHNAIAFRNNPFVVRLELESHSLKGKQSKVAIFDGKKKVYETNFKSNSENYYTTIDCNLLCSEVGQKVYTVILQSFDGEISYKNNKYVFSVDVLESRQKVLLLYDAVHPDVAAVRRAIENNQNFTVTVSTVKDFTGNISDYNCVILHGIPQSYGASKELVKKVNDARIPTIYLYNTTVNLSLLETLGIGLEIRNRNTSTDEVQPRFDKDFSLFELDQETKSFLESAPPLLAPFGNYSTQIQTNVLCWQSINGLQVNRPLIICNEVQGVKRAFVCGEGLWRWRMYNYKKNASFTYFDVFVNKLVSYMALTQKRTLFSVQTKHIVSDNQDVEFQAELYNRSYEPALQKEITLTIKDKKGKEYPFVFVAHGDFYKLQAGKFPPGEYSYKAKVTMDGSDFMEKGVFYVISLQIEHKQTQANHALLQTISDNTGGKLFYKNQWNNLLKELQENNDIVSVSHIIQERTSLLDSTILLILLIVFAAAEWFLRKYYGSY